MVTIINHHLRGKEGEKRFISLELMGEVELIQSQNTGRFYATAKRCFISSTFNEEYAKGLIGKKLPGSIVRMECDAYDFTIPESGEMIKLAHTYGYIPEEKAVRVVPLQKTEFQLT